MDYCYKEKAVMFGGVGGRMLAIMYFNFGKIYREGATYV